MLTGLGKLYHDIHDGIYDYLNGNWIDSLPHGKLIETELKVKAHPVHGITLWGYADGVIELESGGYCVMDIKTTSKPQYVRLNYRLQLNTYAYCLMSAKEGDPSYSIDQLGILSLKVKWFGANGRGEGGIVDDLDWHAVDRYENVVGDAIGEALMVLSQETPSQARDGCEWYEFYGQLGRATAK